jgi:hypothetical protein
MTTVLDAQSQQFLDLAATGRPRLAIDLALDLVAARRPGSVPIWTRPL